MGEGEQEKTSEMMKLLMFLLITIDTCTSYTFTFGVD
jgi:hypothetical protein